MTIAEILRAGKARLLATGWCQGDEAAIYAGPPRKLCAATAIGNGDYADSKSLKLASNACGLLQKVIGCDSLADWNDAPERTLEDVLAAYDRTITEAQEAQQ